MELKSYYNSVIKKKRYFITCKSLKRYVGLGELPGMEGAANPIFLVLFFKNQPTVSGLGGVGGGGRGWLVFCHNFIGPLYLNFLERSLIAY